MLGQRIPLGEMTITLDEVSFQYLASCMPTGSAGTTPNDQLTILNRYTTDKRCGVRRGRAGSPNCIPVTGERSRHTGAGVDDAARRSRSTGVRRWSTKYSQSRTIPRSERDENETKKIDPVLVAAVGVLAFGSDRTIAGTV